MAAAVLDRKHMGKVWFHSSERILWAEWNFKRCVYVCLSVHVCTRKHVRVHGEWGTLVHFQILNETGEPVSLPVLLNEFELTLPVLLNEFE